MKILVRPITSTIEDPREHTDALAIIHEVCRARPAGYKFMPKYRMGVWDGYISLTPTLSSFPTGLLNRVIAALVNAGFQPGVYNDYEMPPHRMVRQDTLTGVELRDYQVEAANLLLSNTRGIAKMATGSGKTEVMASIIKAIGAHALVLVARKDLMVQTVDRFQARGLKNIGTIGDGTNNPNKITVAMIQTLSKMKPFPAFFKTNTVLMIDECHHTSSDQFMDVLPKIPGIFRFGFSGTPLKDDLLSDLKLIGSTGDVLYEVTNEYMIEAGYSAKPTIYVHIVECKDEVDWKMDYAEAYDKHIVNSEPRNRMIAKFAKKQTGTVLIMVNKIEHGEILRRMIPSAIFVHGGDTTERRVAVLEQMRTQPGIFIASPIFDEGIDAPALDVVILAGGDRSPVKMLQRIGRGLRQKKGVDNRLIVLDFLDDTNKHLLDHSDARVSLYMEEGFETKFI